MTKKKTFEFNPKNIKLVKIKDIRVNPWNPKDENPKEYQNVLKSIKNNGYAQPILVRQNNGYEIIDGQHRYLASKELGYKEIYVYDCGNISDADAKAMTIFMQVSVPFSDIKLAPLAVELNQLDIELPYSDIELQSFEEMAKFDFEEAYKDTEPLPDENKDGFRTLNLKLTTEQFNMVTDALHQISEGENVSQGRALELALADFIAGYIPTNSPENDPSSF